MMSRFRTLPILACVAIVAATLSSNTEAGFGLFKRFKKKATCCPQPATRCCPSHDPCERLPSVKEVTGMICYEHEDYPGYPLEAYDPAPPSSTTKTCETLEMESCNSIVLPPGSTEHARGCYEASGCDSSYECEPCNYSGFKSAPVLYEARWYGWCRNGRCIEGTIIRAPDRHIAIEQARAALSACSQLECCDCLVRLRCCVKRVR